MRRFAPRALVGLVPSLTVPGSTTGTRDGLRPGARADLRPGAGPDTRSGARPEAPRRGHVLLELTRSLNRAGTPDEVARALSDVARRGLGARTATVAVTRPGRRGGPTLATDTGTHTDVADATPGAGRAPLRTVLPLPVADGVVGALTLVWEHPRALDDDDRALLAAVAAAGATALQRALLAQRHHDDMAVLRDALLPDPHFDVAGVDVAVRDLAVGTTPVVGGDWYDCFPLPHGHVALVVGDVVGHGLHAARAMGALRHAAKALALVLPDPAQVVAAMNTLLRREPLEQMASMVFVDLDPATGTARVAVAGHLPPLLVRPGGATRYLEQAGGPLLGVVDAAAYPVACHHVPSDAALVLYTDGLVERRDAGLDDGLEALAAVAACHWVPGTTTAQLADALFTHRPTVDDVADDLSVLVARRATADGSAEGR